MSMPDHAMKTAVKTHAGQKDPDRLNAYRRVRATLDESDAS